MLKLELQPECSRTKKPHKTIAANEKGCKQDAHVLLIAANQKPAAGKSTT